MGVFKREYNQLLCSAQSCTAIEVINNFENLKIYLLLIDSNNETS